MDLQARLNRCVLSLSGIMSKEEAKALCDASVLASRGLVRKTRKSQRRRLSKRETARRTNTKTQA